MDRCSVENKNQSSEREFSKQSWLQSWCYYKDIFGMSKVLLLLNIGTPHFYIQIYVPTIWRVNRQSWSKISVQVVFQWNDVFWIYQQDASVTVWPWEVWCHGVSPRERSIRIPQWMCPWYVGFLFLSYYWWEHLKIVLCCDGCFFFVQGSPTIIPTVTEKPKRQLVAAIQGMCGTYKPWYSVVTVVYEC